MRAVGDSEIFVAVFSGCLYFFFREWETEKMKKWVVILVHSENMNRSGFFLCAHKVTCSHAHQFAFLLCHPLERPGMRLFCLISWKYFFSVYSFEGTEKNNFYFIQFFAVYRHEQFNVELASRCGLNAWRAYAAKILLNTIIPKRHKIFSFCTANANVESIDRWMACTN